MEVNPLSRMRAIVDKDGKPTQVMQLFSQFTSDAIALKSNSESPIFTNSVTFSGVGNRIYGDFSNATTSNRTLFQTTALNSVSIVGVIASGSSTSSSFVSYNSSDADNASFLAIANGSATTTLLSSRTGAAPFLPLVFHVGGAARFNVDISGNLIPQADNAYTAGQSGLRFSAFWGANGTIQTSDIRTKTDIEECVLGLDFINYLEPISYKFIVGGNDVTPGETEADDPIITPRPGVRTHYGFSAQHVKQIADIFGVDFGAHVLADINDPDSQQGLRMDQFIPTIVKAIQEQSAIIDSLLARIEALEND